MKFNFPQNNWLPILKNELESTYFLEIEKKLLSNYKTEKIFPPQDLIFNAFKLCDFDALKIVIIGQDPYHKFGQANGLSFSVNDDIKIPPSLKNIFKELHSQIPDFEIPKSGNLTKWAKQGVLLLNSVLTVKENTPASHKDLGWQNFTDTVIKLINNNKTNVVFILWGNYAQNKSSFITNPSHLILKSAHPSPLARGAFFGNNHFSETNIFLKKNGLSKINWNLCE